MFTFLDCIISPHMHTLRIGLASHSLTLYVKCNPLVHLGQVLRGVLFVRVHDYFIANRGVLCDCVQLKAPSPMTICSVWRRGCEVDTAYVVGSVASTVPH